MFPSRSTPSPFSPLELPAHRAALISPAGLALWQLNHSEWMAGSNLLTRRFVFQDFKQAFAFMTQVALHAEEHQHHPEWSNTFNRVDITLTTHDAQGITQLDLDLAAYADQAYQLVRHH